MLREPTLTVTLASSKWKDWAWRRWSRPVSDCHRWSLRHRRALCSRGNNACSASATAPAGGNPAGTAGRPSPADTGDASSLLTQMHFTNVNVFNLNATTDHQSHAHGPVALYGQTARIFKTVYGMNFAIMGTLRIILSADNVLDGSYVYT